MNHQRGIVEQVQFRPELEQQGDPRVDAPQLLLGLFHQAPMMRFIFLLKYDKLQKKYGSIYLRIFASDFIFPLLNLVLVF